MASCPHQVKDDLLKTRIDLLVVVIAYVSFVVLGMPAAMIGAVWDPHVYQTFGLQLDALGLLLFTGSAGYFFASYISGRLFARFNVGALLVASALIGAVGFLGYALAPAWWLMVGLGLVTGFGGGILDSGMNIYFAAHFGPRLMNWLHACFGIGTTLSPLLAAAIFRNEGSWRAGYAVIAVLHVMAAILFMVTRSRWLTIQASSSDSPARGTPARETLRLPVVWLGIAMFCLYAGLEQGVGSWANSLFQARGMSEIASLEWVRNYWLSFTVGRVIFGFIVSHFRATTLIRFCSIGAIAGMALLTWNPVVEIGAWGIILFGFLLAPIFALMITSTQERLGPVHAPNAIGFQVAAATVGVASVPGAAGVIANRVALESVPPFFLALLVVMYVLYEMTLVRRFTPISVRAAPVEF
jgi:fucose permease